MTGSFFEVAKVGAVLERQNGIPLWVVVDGSGVEVGPCSDFLIDFFTRDMSLSSVKSYARGLLRWFRFIWATKKTWDRIVREDICEFSLWMKHARKERAIEVRNHIPGSVNPITGKPYLGDGYSPNTINHNLAVLSSFYDFHIYNGTGPLVNPVPSRRGRDGGRYAAHHNPERPMPHERRGDYRQKVPRKIPRHMPDSAVDDVFKRLTSHRDRALLAFYLSSAARPSELLGVINSQVEPHEQAIAVVRKGTRAVQRLPASTDSFMWFNLYQAQLPDELRAPDQMAWWTLRRPHRPLNYDAMRAVLRRVNAGLGANWSLHDLRHTAATRMNDDPNMTLSDIQTILGHVSLATTQDYLRPREAEVFDQAIRHFQRIKDAQLGVVPKSPDTPRLAYDSADLDELFGGSGGADWLN